MGNGTHSTHKGNDEEINNRRPRQIGEKEKINPPSNLSDATGLRRSTREASSTKTTPSPPSPRKSERLEKRTTPTPAVSRKSEKVEKPNMPSPLRRSGRNRNHSFLSPSDSKSSGSSSSKQKPEKEKNVKQLIFEAKEVNENDEQDLGTPQVKVKRMDARMYRATFIKPKKDCLEKPNTIDMSTQEGGSNSGGKIDECCRLRGPVKGLLENNATLGSLVPSNATTHETRVARQSVQLGCHGEETSQILVSRNAISDEYLVQNNVGLDSGEKIINRKGTMVDMVSNVSSTLANDNNCILIGEAAPSRLGYIIVGTDGPCSKRRRLDYDPTVSCYNESCNPSAIEDVGDSDPSMLQKECHANTLTNIAKNICLICKSEGQLLFCGGKGCNGCYHPSCLEPPLVDAPIRFWHCHSCVRKKIELGVHSVSEGAESVCDVGKVPFSNDDGSTAQREFLVKYKGLAHVHNRWVKENQLLLEDPSLLMKFNQKDQTLKLKPEWSLPHRLLQKRALTCVRQHDDHRVNHTVDNFDCSFEWLVKWRGLGYEHATWELDNASFLRSPESQSLIRGYEERFQRAKRVSSCSKLNKEPGWRSSVNKLSQLPGGVSSGFPNNLLDAVKKLREHWQKGQSAIVIDDHERILKVVAFIATLQSDIYRPFLIISTAASLHSWEDGFYQLDPSIDVVIYNGIKEMRNSIRRFEFYDEGGCILFQVLIVVPEILIEDLDVLGGIEWEAIIVDECQSPKISSYFKKIKMLNTHLTVLLFRDQLKDSVEENINILALLDCQSGNEKDGSISNSSNNIVELKKRLLSHIAYKCQIDFFRFVEYWVPVQISNVQLEQYCGILLSNASILRSSSKVDTAGPLRDVLNSTQKCCNHPYVLNPSLQPLLTEGLQTTSAEFLDVGSKASGKLQLLDSMLKELRKKDLRALVLFQSIGGSGILVDFLLLRFGQDSYEGVDKSSSLSKKQSAMKKFNNKENGCFIFLLETVACHSNIKLSSVDAIIIFNSDLNPMNDVRSLQKITLDSQFEFIKIFRLYSSFTVEEKALIIAKQDKILDINIQHISPSTTHMLLMWGASCLFDDLRVFHDGETSVSSLKSLFGGEPHLKAIREFSSILSQDGEDNDTSNCSFLLKVQPNGGKYSGGFSLLGEQKLRFLDEEPPHIFWTKLLEGKHFKWKYSCGLSQRSLKKVHHVDGSLGRPDLVSESISKKRRKVSNNIVDQPSSKSGGQKLSAGIKAGTTENPSGDLADGDPSNDVESVKNSRLHDEQRSLHLLLKPEIAKFCEVLLLPDNVKSMVDSFLGYVINNHSVPREPVSILQAFQISLIWAAASFVKHNLDQNASLIHAKENLNFDCKKVEVEYLYSMLRCLKNIFLYRTGISSDTGSPKASESPNGVYSCTEREVELFKKDMSKSIKETKKKLKKKLTKLFSMQLEEKQRLKAASEDEKACFDNKYKLESAAIRCCSPNGVVREEKLKDLSTEYATFFEELKREHETHLKDLEDMQSAKIRDFQDQEAAWVEELKSWAKNELSNIGASKELGNGVDYLQTCDEALPHKGLKNVDLVSGHFTEGKGHNNMVEAMTSTTTGVPENNSPTVVLCSGPIELQTPLVKHIGANGMSIMASEDRPASRSEVHNIAENEQISEGTTSTADEGDGHENFSRGSRDAVDEVLDRQLSRSCGSASPSSGPHNISLSNPPLEHQNPDGVSSSIHGQFPVEVPETSHKGDTVSVLEREIPAEMPGMVNFTNCPANATPVDTPSENQISEGGSANVPVLDDVLSARPCGAASPCDGPVTDPILNQQFFVVGVSLSIPDGHIPVIVPENSHAVADCYNNVEPLTNAGLVRTTSGHQEGVPKTMTECTLSQDTPASRSVDVVEPLEQVQELSSAESPPDQDTAGEMLNSSEQYGLVSSPVDVLPANQSNHASLIMNPSEPVQQLMSAELPSSNPDPSNIHLSPVIEHQPINEGDLPFHDPEASTVVPNQDVVQPDSYLGLDSHSHQVVMHPASNSNMSSLSPGGAGTQPSDTRNLSTPSGISNHNHPIQIEHQPINEGDPPFHDPEASTVVPNQDVVQPDSYLGLDSHSHQVVMHPASNSNMSSLSPGGAGTQPSDTRNLSTPSGISNHNHPIQIEHQPINEGDLPFHDPEASTVVPNQDVVQPDSYLELDSHSHQVVMHPASNSNMSSLSPGGAGTQPSDTRNLSTPSGISNHNHPIQIEHQPINEGDLPFHDPEASTVVPNQDVVQPDSYLGLDSHSHQVVMHPASNSNMSSLSPGGAGTQPSDTRNLSTPSGISNHNHPIQIEHQPINEGDLPFRDPEASTVVPNQDVVQPDSYLGLDSHQVVMHPASNSNMSSLSPGGAETQPSDTRNLSTPSGISNHNHPIQTATHSASRILPPLCSDPLKYELERMQQVTEQIKKNHEDMKLQLKSDFEKEYAELRMKYVIKYQEIKVEFQQTKKNLDTSLNVVLMNKTLADAFRSTCVDLKASGGLGVQQDAGSANQLPQHSRQCGATHPSMVAGPSFCAPPAPSLHNPSTTMSPQNVVAPIQPAYNTPGVLSGVSARPPLINSVSLRLGDLQAGGDMRAPAPHLQPYSPSTSIQANSLPALPRGVPGQPAPVNIIESYAFSHGPPRPRPTTYQSDPHLGCRPDNAGWLPTANFSAVDLPNVRSWMSNGTSLNPSIVGTINSSHEAPDFVYLSDDE